MGGAVFRIWKINYFPKIKRPSAGKEVPLQIKLLNSPTHKNKSPFLFKHTLSNTSNTLA